MPSSISVDRQNGDGYVSDGESAGGNRRIAVFDARGTFLRQWQPDGMETVHCMTIGRDGLVYVCNRAGSRIQVYDKMGAFRRAIEVPWIPVTPPADGAPSYFGGSTVAIDFSPDERLIFVINQNNAQIEMIDRESGKKLSRPVQPAARNCRRCTGQRLHCREPRQAGAQVHGGGTVDIWSG